MRRSRRAPRKTVDEDEEDEDWVGSMKPDLKVRASRVLDVRDDSSESDHSHSSKKRLRKAGGFNHRVADEIETNIVPVGNPFSGFQFEAVPRQKANRGFSLRGHEPNMSPPPAFPVPSEAAYDGTQSWLDPLPLPAPVAMPPPKVSQSVGNDSKRGKRRKFVTLSSDDEEDNCPGLNGERENGATRNTGPSNGGGGVVVDLVGDDPVSPTSDEAIAERLQREEFAKAGFGAEEEETNSEEPEEENNNDELDLIFSTLQKCDQVAQSLRQDLHGNSGPLEDRYAEVDPSAAKLVTQSDVCAACGISPSESGQYLKPYQLVGVNFMLLLNRKKVGGAILADEMGLGKTVQAVAFLALLKHLDNDPGPHLIVCPASLLENWQRELQKWCPSFKVVLFHGNERASLIRELKGIRKGGNAPPFNVMLTCYSLFERNSVQQKDDRGFLRKYTWSCVLMDEAHFLKDRGALRTKRLRDIAQKAKQRVMLTGTPLQNDLQELWALLEFLLPDIFSAGDTDLSKLLGTRNSTATILQEDGDLISHMKAILGPFVLRRLKSDVMQQLVPKIHKVECIPMVDDQSAAYREAVVEYRDMTAAARASRADDSGKEVSFPRRQIQNIFTQLRKVANHPLLVRRLYDDRDVEILAQKLHAREVFGNQCTEERVVDELKGYNDFTLYQLCMQNGLLDSRFGAKLTADHPLASAKCQVLAKLLPDLKREGHRPLIFSQWTQMLDILEWACDVLGLRYLRLDGSTQVRERQEIVDTFNNDPSVFVFLLSTRAGGQGLNLTGADTVIIHDVDFNPQMDRQAEDRCHRIGQMKPVTVYRLVTQGSVDESIYNIAQRKLVLDAAVLEGGAMSKENGEHLDGDAQTMEEILSTILAAVPS